jgi:hypothetical protein
MCSRLHFHPGRRKRPMTTKRHPTSPVDHRIGRFPCSHSTKLCRSSQRPSQRFTRRTELAEPVPETCGNCATCLDNFARSEFSLAEDGDRSPSCTRCGRDRTQPGGCQKTCRTNNHQLSSSGELPSKAQYETVLNLMEEYITEHNTPKAWRKANKNVAEIGRANFPDRKWNTKYKPTKLKNFRRYSTKNSSKRIQEFIDVFRRELQAIPDQRKDEPLTRSRVYIGWTVHEATRDQHYAHSSKGSQVA